jgi:hypothetical protein
MPYHFFSSGERKDHHWNWDVFTLISIVITLAAGMDMSA